MTITMHSSRYQASNPFDSNIMDGNIKILKVQPISGMQFSTIGHNLSQHLELGSNGAGINSSNQNLVDLGKQLLEACKDGDTVEVKSLMQNGAPFTTDWLGTSPLHFAAQYGHADTTEVLLKAGVSRDTRTKVDRTPLHIAAQEGHVDIVSLLITYGADLDAKDLLRMTPLHWAVERGHRDVVECLLANGADANCVSKFDKTPLDIAYEVGRNDLVPLLQSYSSGTTSRQMKNESRTPNTHNTRSRPTVLPNKANRTARMMPKQSPVTITSTPGGGKVFQVPVTAGKQGLTVENVKKLLAQSSGDTVNNVLSTLTALATSGNVGSKILSEEAMEWLQQLNSNEDIIDDPSLVDSALNSGQCIKLTEAGKLTLNQLRVENKSSNNNNGKKVITIVADSNQLPQIIKSTQSTPIVVLNDSKEDLNKRTTIKVSRPINIANLPANVKIQTSTSSVNNNTTTITTRTQNVVMAGKHAVINNITSNSVMEERDRLRKENELLKKDVERLKKEADSIRKQLEDCKKELEKSNNRTPRK